MMKNKMQLIDKIYLGLLAVILGGIVMHAPMSVGLGVLFPDYDLLIKSWKEILMLVAGMLLLAVLYQRKQLNLLKDKLIVLIGLYGLLHLGMLLVNNGFQASLAGLAIDLRYILYFALVYLAIRLYPDRNIVFYRLAFYGTMLVLGFAILQVFVLPKDILKYIGYSVDTIVPYLTVDLNESFIRINSTLRGPNPLGAYTIMTLAGLSAYWLKNKLPSERKWLIGLSVLSLGSMVALWSSYSRSALIGAVLAVSIVLAFGVKNRKKLIVLIKKYKLFLSGATIMLVFFGAFLLSDPHFVSNVILHENPNDVSTLNSNEGHAASLSDGIELMLANPLGSGIGSAGSASLFTDNPIIIENQYLFIAHEVGWLGLAMFLAIFVIVERRLFRMRNDWRALAVMSSGIGLALVGVLLPVWVDDTVSIVWWGLAGAVLASAHIPKGAKNAKSST